MKQAILTYATILFIFFFPFFTGKLLYYADNYTFFWPLKKIAADTLKMGKLPLWNSYIFSGQPLLADMTVGSLSPFMPLYLLFPTPYAISMSTILALFITGVGMYAFAKSQLMNHQSALATGLVWMISGSLLERTSNVVIIETLAFIPWLFLLTHRAVKKKSSTTTICAALAMALSLYAGYLPLVILFSIVLIGKFRHRILVAIITAAIGLSALQLIPFVDFFLHSTRVQDPLQSKAMQIAKLPRLLFTKIYGAQNEGNSWGPNAPPETGFAGTDGYISAIGILLILTHLSSLKKKQPYWVVTAALSLGISMTKPLPLLNQIQPYQFLVIFSFAASILLGFTLSEIKWRPSLIATLMPLATTTLITIFINWFQLPYQAEKEQIIKNVLNSNLITVGALLTLTMLIIKIFHSRPQLKRTAIILLMVSDIYLLGRGSLFFASSSLFDLHHPAIDYLTENIGKFRMLSYAGTDPYSDLDPLFNQLKVRQPFGESNMNQQDLHNEQIIKAKAQELPPNLASLFHLPTVNGYSGLVSQETATFWAQRGTNKLPISISDQQKLDQMSVKFLLARTTSLIPAFWHPVFIKDNFTVYENKSLRPLKPITETKNYFPLSVQIGLLISLMTAVFCAVKTNFFGFIKINIPR